MNNNNFNKIFLEKGCKEKSSKAKILKKVFNILFPKLKKIIFNIYLFIEKGTNGFYLFNEILFSSL